MYRKALWLGWLLLIGVFVHAQIGKADATVQQIMNETRAVGLSAVVVKNGKVVFNRAYGFKDLENRIPLAPHHMFRIASISKSFSATAIMQLVESGKLNLDEDVSKLVGFTVRNPRHPNRIISLRLMLSHFSSINDSQGYFSLDVIDPSKNQNWEKAYSDFAPGDSFLYCNLNYNMIGSIIERVSSERFDQYVIRHVLDPLKIYGGYSVAELDSSRFAYIYEYKGDSSGYVRSTGAYAVRPEIVNGYQMGRTTPVFSPTGGMKISAPDLAQYMMMHMNYGTFKRKKVLSKESAEIMQRPVSEKEPYGFALETSTTMVPGLSLIGHTGVAYGLYSAMFFDPAKRNGVVVIINGCPPEYESGYNAVIRKSVIALYQNLLQ
ncbi:MAG: serine hydrolase domain-containing protein [Bacteroidota bacterium]